MWSETRTFKLKFQLRDNTAQDIIQLTFYKMGDNSIYWKTGVDVTLFPNPGVDPEGGRYSRQDKYPTKLVFIDDYPDISQLLDKVSC